MAHNINLLQLPRTPRTGLLSLSGVLALFAVAGLAVLVLGLIQTQRVQVLAASVAQGRAQASARTPQQDVAALDAATQALVQRRAALAALDGLDAHARAGYAGHLQALARAAIPGVWLSGVSLARSQLQLHAHASDSSRISAYLASLRREPLFAGQVFDVIEVKAAGTTAAERGDSTLEFMLATSAADTHGTGAQP